ncbi:FG-GAP-like repeat-containing protein [Planctomycetota bacterium]
MSVVVGCRQLSDEEEERAGADDRQSATTRPSFSPDESWRIIRRMNVAVGHLENEESAEAEPLLEELTEAVPGEITLLRNLAICRLLMVRDLTLGTGTRLSPQERAEALKEAIRKARATLDQLIDADRDSAIAWWLRGKVELVASAESGLETAAAYLERAAAKEPDNIIVRYELYNAARYASGEAFKPHGIKALREAYEARPDNLFLMLEWLNAQVAAKDLSVVETLSHAKEQLGPLRESITSADVFSLIDAAREAAKQGNWPGTLRKTRPLLSVTKPQDAVQSDRKELTPRVVEYVVSDFSAEFYKMNPPSKPAELPAIEVAMERIAPQFPSVENVRDMDLVDFDVDGTLDVVLLRKGHVEVFSRQASTAGWTRIADAEVPSTMSRLIVADLYMVDLPDAPKKHVTRSVGVQASRSAQQEAVSEIVHHNVYPGIAVFGTGGIRLLRNNLDRQPGSPVLELVEQSAQIQQLSDILHVLPADLDHEGDLDLVVAAESGLSLWSNRANMTFQNIDRWSVLPAGGVGVTGMIAVDWDRDGDIDVLLSGPGIENGGLLENVRHGQFHWMPFEEPYRPLGKAPSFALLDADGNRSWDVLAAGPSGVQLVTTTTPRPGDVEHLRTKTLADRPQDGCAVWDFDNDGYLDVLTWGEGIHVLRGVSDGSWLEIADMVPEPPAQIIQCVPADLDNDGDLDLAVAADNGVTIYTNQGGNRNHYLAVRVRGTNDQTKCGRVNHYCIGSLLEVRCGAHYQAQVITRQTTHFGLGNTDRADVLRMLLTNDVPQHVIQPEADQLLREFMTSKGM